MPQRLVEIHTLQGPQKPARRILIYNRGIASRVHRRPQQAGLFQRHHPHDHLDRPRGRLHHRPVLPDPTLGHRSTPHPRRHIRPRPRRPPHHGHAQPLPQPGHRMGQPRRALDGRGSGQPGLRGGPIAPFAALRQHADARRGLRHQHGAPRHLCHGDVCRR